MKSCRNKNCTQINPQSLDNFYKNKTAKDGHNGKCKPCVIEARRIYRETYPEKVKESHKTYYKNNKEAIIEKASIYYEENKKSVLNYKKIYYQENKEEIIEYKTIYQRERTKKDPLFKLRRNLRRRMSLAFVGLSKSKNTIRLLGCSIEEACIYIESQFYNHPVSDEPMTWDNYGKMWDLDHKDPLALGSTKEEIETLCHYTNIQPLWKDDHKIKTYKDHKRIKFNKNNKL